MHPIPERAEDPDPPRRNPISKAAQDREQLRSAQGLAARRHALRQMPKGVSVSMRSRRRRHVLAMSPDPSGYEAIIHSILRTNKCEILAKCRLKLCSNIVRLIHVIAPSLVSQPEL